MSHDKIAEAADAIRTAVAERIDPVAEHLGVSPRLLLSVMAFVILLALAGLHSLFSLFSSSPPESAQAPAPAPVTAPAVSPPKLAPTPVRQASAVQPAQPQPAIASTPAAAPAVPLQAELPALPSPASPMKSGAWQLTVQTVAAAPGQDPTTLPGQVVGTVVKASPTASFSGAVPDSMAAFVTAGKPVRLTYTFNFEAPTTGAYLITVNLSGNASAAARVLLDGRADSLVSLKRAYNALWAADAPAQAGSASVTLAAGLHSIEVVLDTTAATQAAHAPTVDLYIKPQAAAMPAAMVPMWPASSPAAPASAPAARR
ncbi:hypothetical protein GALL_245000 [mine drainage metagenome]|uniref:Uncharacterized protein n=1 Tax=mine drainage metagenome TaxID=410659 RepID=A0A1J5RN88_9ZZZZ